MYCEFFFTFFFVVLFLHHPNLLCIYLPLMNMFFLSEYNEAHLFPGKCIKFLIIWIRTSNIRCRCLCILHFLIVTLFFPRNWNAAMLFRIHLLLYCRRTIMCINSILSFTVPWVLLPATTVSSRTGKFTVNFTITNLQYSTSLRNPYSSKFSATARVLSTLVSVIYCYIFFLWYICGHLNMVNL